MLAAVTVMRKALNETCAREHATAETWKKEKINTHLLEQQLDVTQGVAMSHQKDDARSEDASSNPNATPVSHLHATLMPPWYHTCTLRLQVSKTFDRWL
jgi:hypothetical protein